MNNKYINITAIVEGKTEQIFIEKILAPYLSQKHIGIVATQASKPGQKGGNIKFSRIKNDLRNHLKQRSDTYITTLIDYYGTNEWPGIGTIPNNAEPRQVADIIYQETLAEVNSLFEIERLSQRFIPFMAIHEFEALLFSDIDILAKQLGIDASAIKPKIDKYDSPESINNNRETAPSKRLKQWAQKPYVKTVTGINIAAEIGIDKMRKHCPIFNEWLEKIENIRDN